MSNQIVFIAPYGPSGTNGICDHVTSLVNAMSADADLAIQRIGVSTGTPFLDAAHTVIVEKADVAGLQKALERTISPGAHVFVHYVNYGYDRNGCPFGLLRSLKALREKRNFHLVTMFHELAASGPPWKSACYTGPFQSYVWRKQASISDKVATSTPAYKKRIQRVCANVETHPVFSNVGEPDHPSALSQRAPRAVLFGQSGSRKHVIRSGNLAHTIQMLGIEEVVEIGRPNGEPAPRLSNVKWTRAGELSASDVSLMLVDSRFGLLCYAPQLLPKSGVFAAYCSHRVAPVIFPETRQRSEDLQSGKLYFDAGEMSACREANAQTVADFAWNWYRNTWSVQQCAALYRRWINDRDQQSSSTALASGCSAFAQTL